MFVIILAVSAIINIFSSHLLAVINNISVWWHVAGAAAVILILLLIPEQHASFSDVFAKTINNSGMFGGDKGIGWLIFVLPIAAILTQYTITGYDASAHLSEETKSAADGAAKGIWRSIFYSAIGGWILLLAFLFAVQDSDEVSAGGGAGADDLHPGDGLQVGRDRAADLDRGPVLLHDGLPDERVAHAVRVQPRPRGAGSPAVVEGELEEDPRQRRHGHRGAGRDHHACPPSSRSTSTARPFRSPSSRWSPSVWSGCTCASPCRSTTAGRLGDAFPVGRWNLRGHHKWMAPVAMIEIVVTSLIAMFPTSIGGVPFGASFEWKFVNYTPLLVGGVLILLYIYWHVSVKNWFTGPIKQVDETGEELEGVS